MAYYLLCALPMPGAPYYPDKERFFVKIAFPRYVYACSEARFTGHPITFWTPKAQNCDNHKDERWASWLLDTDDIVTL